MPAPASPPGDELAALDATDEDAGESCNAKVIVDRATAGSMAPAVTGSIQAISRGTSSFITAP